MIKDFLFNLSYRQRSENSLSDVTWAMCNASENFKELFLNFFFSDTKFKNITRFERESSKGNSRSDFLIENDGDIFLIECKINDGNHHFEQYTSTFNIENKRLGYITNYHMIKEGFEVKTWEQFYDEVERNLPDNEGSELWKGYLEYLKSVCLIVKITKKMDLKGMYSVYSFTEILKKLVNRTEEEKGINLSYYKTTNKYTNVGHYFGIDYPSSEIEKTWAWIGVYFDREIPIITISFDNAERWGKPIYKIFDEKMKEINSTEISTEPYKEDGCIWFDMSEQKQEEFQNSDLERQQEILIEFIDEVIKKPLII